MSFAGIRDSSYAGARKSMCRVMEEQYHKYSYLLEGNLLNEKEKFFYHKVSDDMSDNMAVMALRSLADFLSRYYDKKVIILLDEYDTPIQEAYMCGYWDEMITFVRSLFNATFKDNPYLERAIVTGMIRIGMVSNKSFRFIFSDLFTDLNWVEVTTISNKYMDYFGFTEKEVFEALDEFNLLNYMQQITDWYGGFTFGNRKDIYNPCSVINFLDKKKVASYWDNTSSNSLIEKLVQEDSRNMRKAFERLLQGKPILAEINKQIAYDLLDIDEQTAWSFMLASGYLKVKKYEAYISKFGKWKEDYELELTNFEVKALFQSMLYK